MRKIMTLIVMIQIFFIGTLAAQPTSITITNNSQNPVLYGSGGGTPTHGLLQPGLSQSINGDNSPFNFCYGGKNFFGDKVCNPGIMLDYISSCSYTNDSTLTVIVTKGSPDDYPNGSCRGSSTTSQPTNIPLQHLKVQKATKRIQSF